MQMKPGSFCPLIKDECMQLKCAWFMQVRGKHPQTGEDLDEWGCSVVWTPFFMMENAKQTTHTTAAVESFRNEMARTNYQTSELLTQALAKPEPTNLIEVN